jgi:hypothetical protein
MSGRRRNIFIGTVTVFGFFVVLSIVALLRPQPPTFAFVQADHPIEMWNDGKDRWAYFMSGERDWTALVEEARSELNPQGFVEDRSRSPWICFSNGSIEVVLTDHSAFGVNATGFGSGKLIRNASVTTKQWPCVLVKNGPGTGGSMAVYQMKKLVLRW